MTMALATVARAMATERGCGASDNEGDGGGHDCGSDEGGRQ